jgi:regulatory protein YycH of two-component signal transduction system YycFG
LDSTFVPATPEATEFFVEKQKFVYAIFDKILLTDNGKLLVRQYASTFDAQKVFRDLTVYSNTSTMAARVALDLLTLSTKFGDGTLKGTAQGFILNWQDKV